MNTTPPHGNFPARKSSMRILIVHNDGLGKFPSGELTIIHQEAEALRARGHYVQVFIFKPQLGKGSIRFFQSVLKVLNLFWSWSMYQRVLAEIDRHRPNVVHFHSIMPFLSPAVLAAAKRHGVPVVQTLHNARWLCVEGGLYRNGAFCDACLPGFGWRGFLHGCSHGRAVSWLLFMVNLFYRYTGLLFRWVDRFVAVSDFVRDNHVRCGFPAQRIVVLNNGLEDWIWTLAKQKPTRSGIAFIGRISHAKGSGIVKTLIPHFKEQIQIVGTGQGLVDLKEFCRLKGLTNVHFHGSLKRQKTMEILNSSACVLIPSQCGDSFPTVAIEALGLGVPVVASKLGGLTELITVSGGGILVEPNNPEGFIEAVRNLLANPALRLEMGRKGESFARQHLTIDKATSILQNLFRELISGNKRGS